VYKNALNNNYNIRNYVFLLFSNQSVIQSIKIKQEKKNVVS